jgi:rare lipoprotein A
MHRGGLILVSLVLFAGCGTAPRGQPRAPAASGDDSPPSSLAPPDGCQRGPVTYYADSLAGHPTASGEIYDPQGMTAAHRSLPLGTWLRVVWQGREVRVRVNDRGGPRGGVDLSRAAAERLEMLRAGRITGQICAGQPAPPGLWISTRLRSSSGIDVLTLRFLLACPGSRREGWSWIARVVGVS